MSWGFDQLGIDEGALKSGKAAAVLLGFVFGSCGVERGWIPDALCWCMDWRWLEKWQQHIWGISRALRITKPSCPGRKKAAVHQCWYLQLSISQQMEHPDKSVLWQGKHLAFRDPKFTETPPYPSIQGSKTHWYKLLPFQVCPKLAQGGCWRSSCKNWAMNEKQKASVIKFKDVWYLVSSYIHTIISVAWLLP